MSIYIVISPRRLEWRTFLLGIPNAIDKEGIRIYNGKRNMVKAINAPDGTPLVVKRYHNPRGVNCLVYSLGIRQPKGKRAYRYAFMLNEHNVNTPEAVAYIEHRRFGILLDSYLVTLKSMFKYTIGEITNAAMYESIAKPLAAFTAHMHSEGILHLDYSPGNILWDQGNDGAYRFSVVDINRIRFGKVGFRAGCRNFARLWGPKAFIVTLVREYAKLRGFDADKSVTIALKARKSFWKRYSRRHKVDFQLEL